MLLRSSALVAAIAAISLLAPPPSAFGQASGTWTSTVDGAWSNNANWSGGVIASGANNTANFNTLDITDQSGVTGAAAVRVDFDGPRTLGHLVFGDTNIATPGVWEITTVDPLTNRLTLADAAKPTITVNQLGVVEPTPGSPPVFDDVIIRPNLAGTQGFDKLGAGIASVTSTYDATTAANNLTGVVNVGAGTLRILAGSTFDTETAITPAVTSFTVGSGAVLAPAAGIRNITMGANSTISASANVSYITAAGGSVISTSAGGIGIGGSAAGDANSGVAITGGGSIIINSSATGVTSIAGVSGAGATATLNLSAGLVRFDRDWDRTGALAVLNLNGTNTDGVTKTGIQLRPNGGAWDGNGLLNTTVTLDRVVLNTNQSTGGNTIGIGALNGTATAELIASGGGVGATTYNVGALNTTAVFNGSIGLNAGAGGRSLVIVKQGTGTWELTGALTYTPQPELSNINRRGGITRVEAGTLKVSGTARLPGGNPESNHAVVGVGDLFSTVDIRAGATLDVSASTGTYSSVALQQTIGRGTIAGTYNHAAGILAPGDTVTGGNTASLIGTAGTMTFANTLTFAGAGQVNFDISPSLTTGNDLLQVGGADLNGTPTIKLGFLGGATSGAYTLINSNTPLVGTTAGWNVLWEGRGAAPTLTQTANQVKVNVSFAAAGMLNWAGSVDVVWNAGAAGTANWHNTTSNAADKFFQLDNVAFRDTSNGVTPPATTAITLNSTVSPAAVLIDSSLNYTISGTGRITGGGSLTKQGSGTATVTTANDYTGGTTIAGGVLNRDANGSFGSGQITFAGGELQSRGWTSLNAISVPAGVTAKI
ncbi:MAG TPA: autotransporter-associated beta strand repeat-containing protein, partial [Lacipirellulaceae bacterium]|nr:autotransporter-associated beta strand repeat-containing protein [Lacipirellulaceae bacterium]